MKRFVLSAVLVCAAAAAGCQSTSTTPAGQQHGSMWTSVTKATAVISPTMMTMASLPTTGTVSGAGTLVAGKIAGTVMFTDVEGGVKIEGTITGLEPNSTHAFHIHEFGDIASTDGMSTGPHYNPMHMHHGGPDSAEHHAGDLGNIKADATGTAKVDATIQGISVAGMTNPILGRGVVVHAGPDDLKTDPTGNAGGRIAVGVIGIAKSVGSPPAIGTRPAK
jgi:superoxide dismutase, Cu-Zn family